MNQDQFAEFLEYRSHSLACFACELARQKGTTPVANVCKLSLIRYYISAGEFEYVVNTFPPKLIWLVLDD